MTYQGAVGRTPRVSDENYLDQISWVNARTSASFDLPCAICGADEEVEMHHIKHIRKNRYSLIPRNYSWEQLMYLRGRKQIPVCRKCHIERIHAGKYCGVALKLLAPRTIKPYDGRIFHIENFVQPGLPVYAKSLREKGWKPFKPSKK